MKKSIKLLLCLSMMFSSSISNAESKTANLDSKNSLVRLNDISYDRTSITEETTPRQVEVTEDETRAYEVQADVHGKENIYVEHENRAIPGQRQARELTIGIAFNTR